MLAGTQNSLNSLYRQLLAFRIATKISS